MPGSGTSTSTVTSGAPRLPRSVTLGIDVNRFSRGKGLQNLPQVLAAARRAGATAIRVGQPWAIVQPTPARTYKWRGLDRILAAAQAQELEVLLEMGDTPAWDVAPRAHGDGAYPPIDCGPSGGCASARQFVTDLVRHVAPFGVRYLIPRNEPQDTRRNWVGGTAEQYAGFQQAVYEAAHAADPRVKVLNGGEELLPPTLVDILQRVADVRGALSFTASLYADPQFCRSLDVLDVHLGHDGPVYGRAVVELSEQAIRRCNGGRPVPVWVTETAYTSLPQVQAVPSYAPQLGGAYRDGDAGQAAFLRDTFEALAGDTDVIGINWSEPLDLPPGATRRPVLTSAPGEGLLRDDFGEKPAFAMFARLAG